MKGLTRACLLVLLVSLVVSGLRLERAWTASRAEAAALARRADERRQLMRSLAPASRAQIRALRERREELAERAGARRASLLDRAFAAPPPALETLLADHTSPLLAADAPFGARMRELAAETPALERGFAGLLMALEDAGRPQLDDLTFRAGGRLRALPDTQGLRQLEFEVVLLDELPRVLAALEAFTPGNGDPLLVVEHASLRRLEPSLWETLPPELTSPPVRLWMHVAMIVGEGRP